MTIALKQLSKNAPSRFEEGWTSQTIVKKLMVVALRISQMLNIKAFARLYMRKPR